MRHLTKPQFMLSIPNKIKLCNSEVYLNHHLWLSTKLSPQKTTTHQPNSKDQSDTNALNSLFKEITHILGAVHVIPDKTLSAFALPQVSSKLCPPPVCVNAEPNVGLQETPPNDDDVDVSATVCEITAIVRAKDNAVPMEERLEKLQLPLQPDIVEKVLERCFKVPHLGFRFFNWVRLNYRSCHTTNIYNALLYIAGEAKQFGVVDGLVDEMKNISIQMDTKTWTILISHYGKAKMIGRALLLFEEMKKSGCEPDVEVYNLMISSLCNANKPELALEFYKDALQRDMRLDLSLNKLLMNCVARLGDVGAIHLVADGMIGSIPERDVRIIMLESFCMAGRIREALELIRDLNNREIPLGYEFFETLVRGLCRADKIADALEIVDIMKRKELVDEKIYGIVINGYLRRRVLPKALNLFQNMNESGLVPTTSTYTELMQYLFRMNEYQKGCELYNEMLERGLKIDSVAVMAVVAGHVRHNHISEAWQVFNGMEDQGIKPSRKSCIIFIKELCRVLQTDEILKVLWKMQASDMFIGDEIFNWVISCMDKKGEMENIKKVKQMQRISRLHSTENEKHINDIYGAVESNAKPSEQRRTESCAAMPLPKAYSVQDLQEVCRLVSSSQDWCAIQEELERCTITFTPDLVVEVLHNCSIHGNVALHFFSWVGKQNGYCHTTEAYNMALKISGHGKDFKHMRSLFYEMRRKGCVITPDTWAIMIMQYGRTGLTEIALKIFREMKGSDCTPTYSTYKHLILCLCGRKGRKVDEAIKIFQEMIRVGHIPDKELAETYIHCLCEAGKLLEARMCIESLCKVGFKISFSHSLYIRALCRVGKLEEALSLADDAGAVKSEVDQYTYGSIVHGLLRKGRVEEALARMDSMKQAGINPNVHVYTSLIVHFFKEKQAEKALGIFEKMQQEGCKPTIVTYSALIRGYMNVGKDSDAWNIFRRLKLDGPPPDFQTYSMFISCLCRANKSEEALQLLPDMLENGIVPSTVNFRTVFFGLNRQGKHDLAHTVLQNKWSLIKQRKL
ncbi:hypothetical protein Tsubulata_015912 [Turnera subulata]|uniref:Pentacotripeptide-repeat region of PRORP domain-containing protein n=1 Tax=Turnera subulata TaxID=218843 RepID=A0A9Q0F6F1_9ROSI|nr:hypothetical protein Tsubulata_015912 [Turnera subulata]